MSADRPISVVPILVCAGLISLLLTLCGVEARPTFASIAIKGNASHSNALEYTAVVSSSNDPDLKDPELQELIESFQVKTSDSGYHLRRRRFRRRRESNSNGNNQQNPKKESGESGEFQNNISTTNNQYRRRNGWGGGYGK